jgi:hypothetical protein
MLHGAESKTKSFITNLANYSFVSDILLSTVDL